MTQTSEHNRAMARNLIDTLGHDRALHVANQFGWYQVAEEIARLSHTAGAAA
ncbi:MAG TPA: hypothetical protein VE631_00605 [Alphaproteobacteria bacterium]|nr:hypothetical protein [Alphaproteobacteria bacterium]